MKKMILTIALLASNFAFAGEVAANGTRAERKAILRTVMNDVMLRGALDEARKIGTCKGSIISSVSNGPQGTEFEAQVNCSSPADEYTGGGTFLMINIKGRTFGDFLDNLVIAVQKAG